MNKCKKCGAEFEGKFCPQCGTPWLAEGEKLCPKCKAVLKANAKFCSECGYSFEKKKAPQPAAPNSAPASPKPAPAHAGSKLLVAYKIASFLPEVLFLLFGVLAFIFLAAPVTTVTSAGLFLGVMDVGSGYNVISLSGVDGLRGPALGFIVFAALGLAFALLCACSTWRKKRSAPLSFGALAFYLADLIIASVMIANTASLDEGLGVLSAGACPVCFLVFSILFAAGHGASLIARNILNKNPEVKAAQAAKEEAEKARREEFYATHKEPVMKTPKSSRQAKKCAVIYKYEKKYYYKGKAKTPSAALVFFDMHKVVLGIAAVVLTVAIVLMATLIPYANNKFRVGVVEKISLGDSKEQVADILGEPYGENRTSNDWFYYDGDLLSYVEKGQNLAKQQEEAIMQGNLTRAEQLAQEAKNLQEQMNSMAFKCIEVTFADEKVESVLLDTRYSAMPQAKDAEKCELLGDVLVGYYEDRTVSPTKYQSVGGTNAAAPYEVRFTDGSYYKTYVKNGSLEITSKNYYSNEFTFLWNDKYGNYSEKITEKEAVNIGTVDKDGAWKANGEGIKKLKMTEFAVPDGVTSIRSRAFADCSGLTSIVISNSVNEIKDGAFNGCSGLESITVAANNQSFSSQDGILYDKEQTKIVFAPRAIKGEVTLPHSVTVIGADAFTARSAMTSIEIPDSVTSIGSDAFYMCKGLTSITIPNSVTEIGTGAFENCDGLTSVTIGSGVTAIGENMFKECTSLTSITIPDGVTSIGNGAFEACSGLTSITIPDSVTSIGKWAFHDCSGLTDVVIPDSVTIIEEWSFYVCSGLTNIRFSGTLQAWQAIDKGRNWDADTGNYTVTCTNGTVKKDRTVTYF